MAQEDAAKFVEKYGSDEAFRDKVNALDTPGDIRMYLDEEGFGEFTRQELEDARNASSADGELSDAELEAVAGGAWGVEMSTDWECTSGYSKDGTDMSCGSYTESCGSVW